MRSFIQRNLLSFVVLTVLVLSLSGVAIAQNLTQDEPRERAPLQGGPDAHPDPTPAAGTGEVEGAEADLILAQPPQVLNYQGYLTDADGNPINDTLPMTAWLYNAVSGGAQVWGPETQLNVAVEKGLFELTLGNSELLEPGLFKEALYVQIEVDGTMLPRQPLRPSPYAFGVLPGANVMGAPTSGDYGLYVENTDPGAGARGVYAKGREFGLVAESDQADGVGVYSPDYIEGRGFRSHDDSYIFVSGNATVPWDDMSNSALVVDPQSTGSVRLSSRGDAGAGTRYAYIPLQLPAVAYGQNVTVEELAVYYAVSDPASHISEVSLEKTQVLSTTGGVTGESEALVVSTTPLDSTTPTSTTLTTAPDVSALSMDEGPLQVRFELEFANTTDTIGIRGVRLRLGHE